VADVRLPSFLVIGAMKAGSTTLYEDLRSVPGIFLPDKELGRLAEPNLSARSYTKLFAAANTGDVLGEVSTDYAKLPQSAGVVDNVRRVVGDDLRLVYIVRNPVDRTVSHHHHWLARRITDPSIDVAIRSDDRLIDFSRYAMQLEPWLELVGADRVWMIQFERYVEDRAGTIATLTNFLGLPAPPASRPLDTVHNASTSRRRAVGLSGRVGRSPVYRRLVRPRLPQPVRRGLGRALLPEPVPRPAPPSEETVDLILARTAADCARLVDWFGERAPRWDAEMTRARYREARREGAV
jgi:hypothetical protein